LATRSSAKDITLTLSTPMLEGFGAGLAVSTLVAVVAFCCFAKVRRGSSRRHSQGGDESEGSEDEDEELLIQNTKTNQSVCSYGFGPNSRKGSMAQGTDSTSFGPSSWAVGPSDRRKQSSRQRGSLAQSGRGSHFAATPSQDDIDDGPGHRMSTVGSDLLRTTGGHDRSSRLLFRGATGELKEKMLNMHMREGRDGLSSLLQQDADQGLTEVHRYVADEAVEPLDEGEAGTKSMASSTGRGRLSTVDSVSDCNQSHEVEACTP